ncbi:hypothetical protein PLESTB_000864600 [Pleodorina starrii]|uniref:Cyclin-like domain-containing protein n=1 Tax=Pleodorina starrii TaxID=330485 RepID=A0A9W6F2Y0_9CHLO|nr:hypothetical protein PLESTB_000864600 [Pleodorina starrii]GLC72102.1 hypothetical protein PLESTF_001204000 [Pleodorina starrii]
MVWCNQCQAEVELEADEANGFSCCVQCGRVVEDSAFSSDVMFAKGNDGGGELVGQMVGANGDAHGIGRYSGGRMWASGGGHEAAVSRGRHEIVSLVEALRISPSSEAIEAAHRLYRLALQRGFTKGRRVNQVAAVCIYIFCRLERRPYMLIDFSDHLSVNVYTLGGVFLSMLRLLRLDEHATFTKPIDPSLFMNRFVDRLRLPTQELKTKIGNTATRLVQSMKRDWMLTGRRPNGICGAALFLAAHIHGVEKTKRDVISIVHVGWSTVEKRVMELAETGGAELTLGEIEERDKTSELERERLLLDYERAALENPEAQPQLAWPAAGGSGSAAGEDGGAAATAEGDGGAVVPSDPDAAGRYCEHVRAGSPLLAHGMCRHCLEEYLQITMAVQQGAQNPPAYVRNLRRDIRKRVRAQMESERPLLMLQGAGGSQAADEDMDVHQARHLENEAAGEADVAEDEAAAGPSSGGRAPAAAAAGKDTEGEGGKVAAITAAEEDDFDEALHSSDLQPLAKALGGVVAAVATAPLQHRKPPDPADAAEAARAEAAAATTVSAGRPAAEAPQGAAAAAGPAPAGDAAAGPGGAAGPKGEAAGGDAAGSAAGADQLALSAALPGEMAAVPTGGASDGDGKAVAAEEEEEEHISDNLSDVEDDEVAGYLATREEANLREQLWVEMNKDWIEKQEAKKAGEAAEANQGGEKPKRKYTRKKAELPAAEDAAGATRNLLASKKLSNKINYGALADLFDSSGAAPGADAGGPQDSFTRGAVSGGDGGGGYSHQEDAGPSGNDGMEDEAAAAGPSKRAAGRARASAAADNDRYTSALEEDQSRLAGLGGGGFLGSLTFMRGGSSNSGARARPQGLSLKPRGR